jgi:hypothetical protein
LKPDKAIQTISQYDQNWVDNQLPSVKWYDWHEHCLEVSKQFPNELFEVYGVGEESGDLWKCYFKNGKSQTCEAKITYDNFDKSKLV